MDNRTYRWMRSSGRGLTISPEVRLVIRRLRNFRKLKMITRLGSNSPLRSRSLFDRSLFDPLLFMRVKPRSFCTTPYERDIAAKLLCSPLLGSPTQVLVEDRSGGCGANFFIMVESHVFRGIPRLKQHKLVQDVLREEIKKWHAVSIETKIPV